MVWKSAIDELAQRRRWAEDLGGSENVGRQHAQGRFTVRERIGNLVDADSFQEIGKLAGAETFDGAAVDHVTPAPYVMGLAKIGGRPVALGGEDFTVRGGTTARLDKRKGGQGGFVEDLAHQYRIPLVNLIDGAGGTVTSAKRRGHTVFPGIDSFDRSIDLMGEVPVVGAVMGAAAGGPAGRAILSHWSVMVRDSSQIFAAGPAVVRRSLGQDISKEDLGGSHVAVDQAGAIDNVAESEEDCFAMIRRFLGYLPQNVWELPPVETCDDPVDRCEEDLLSIVPEQRRRAYKMRKLIEMVVDRESMFEIQPTYGKALITCLARLNGHSVGIIANNPMVYGGAMDGPAARKQVRFIEMCDTFHIPLVFLVDVPGFMVGLQAEQAGVLRDGMRAVYVASQTKVPVITVVIRKCYGMAGMATCHKRGLEYRVAWPSAEWGSLPVEGGVAVAFRREIESADDPKKREEELEEELHQYGSPMRTAAAFGVEDILDPRETRPYLCQLMELAQSRMKTELGPIFKTGVRP